MTTADRADPGPQPLTDEQLDRARALVAEVEAGHPHLGATPDDELMGWQREMKAMWALNLTSVGFGYLPGLLSMVDRLRAERDDPRHISDMNDRCPECGGYSRRGCGNIWHDGKPDSHCSMACQCRDDDRALIRTLATERDALAAERATTRRAVDHDRGDNHDSQDAT